ncbi:DUF6233 domain-containing protein [Streptomyces goshikiensis]|uniref:DUF6233 domain-containing protein n=1 Tax=Streptomyces TaxID=1883 RepID=UPI000C27D0A5|nr:DUF6233 domain-containing protein [Streptomyces sp. CB02120-2]PJN14630.1 hypothetical protein CG724_33660 [Streptomyces sp. CB02120-2]
MTDPARPPVLLTLPDRQEIRATLLARRWTPAGWRYQVAAPLWSVTVRQTVEPVEYAIWVPADPRYIRPVPGVVYDRVPTEDPRTSTPAPAATGASLRWTWTVQTIRTGGPGRGTTTLVHEHGCPAAPAGGPELDLDEALTALARTGARACQTCAAAEVLTRL